MVQTILHIESNSELAEKLTKKAHALLSSFKQENMTIGEIDWMLAKTMSLLAFATFQDISYPEEKQTPQRSA